MNKVVDIGKNVFDKYNQLVIQPNVVVNPSVFTFTKDNMIFVVESGGAGIMGHSHELYEVSNEDKDAIISFKMARTYLHEHDETYFIEKDKQCNLYSIRCTKHGIKNDRLINMSSEFLLHMHCLKIREIFKDSVRIFSDYRDIQVISNEEYVFEIQLDEVIIIEHIHHIQKIHIPKGKMFRNAEVAFVLTDNLFHGHPGIFYIEKRDDDDFVIKHGKRIVHKTMLDDKFEKHEHNIKIVRVTKRADNKNVLLEDPVPDHESHEICHVAKMLLLLT